MKRMSSAFVSLKADSAYSLGFFPEIVITLMNFVNGKLSIKKNTKMFKKLQTSLFALWLLISAIGLQVQTAVAIPSGACFQGASGGYVRPRLKVGIQGHSVTTSNLKIHQSPGLSSRITGSLSPRSTFTVVAGPECVESHVWWKVDNGQIIGWVAEADPATFKYWLAPNNN